VSIGRKTHTSPPVLHSLLLVKGIQARRREAGGNRSADPGE